VIPFSLSTGVSAWYPLALLAGMLVMIAIVFIVRRAGKRDFKYDKEKALPFYSGHVASEDERVKASDFFWGFFEAFKGFYSSMDKIHNGLVNDYVSWFVVVASILLIALAAGVIQWV